MDSNPSTVKTPNVQATGLMANPSSSHPPQSASPIPFQQAPYYPGQQPGQIQWQMPYPPQYVQAAPQPVQNPVQPVPQQSSRQKSGQPQAGEPHIVHHHVYPQVIQNPGMQQGPVTYQVTPTQPFPIWPTNYTYVPQPAPAQVPPPPQFQETTKPVQTTNATQQPPQQQQQTTENSVPLLKMAQNNTTNNTTQPTEGAQQQPQQQQTSGQTQPNAFVQLSQQKFAQPIDYSLPAPPKSFCPQYRAQPKVPVAPVVQFPAMNVAMPYGYGAVQPVYGQPVDYLGNFIQPPNPYGTCNQAFQTANNNGYSYQPIAQY